MSLAADGFALIDGQVPVDTRALLRESVFRDDRAGERCLLDVPLVREVALLVKRQLVEGGILPPEAVAIQAIAFDKTAGTNWKVAWHQDLMFPFAGPVTAPGYETPSLKQGVDFARPPVEVLETLLAARLHLDDCGEANGPLRVSPGTHVRGVIGSSEVGALVSDHGERVCVAGEGEILLMRPLLLHASSQADKPGHRRVLHFVYHVGGRLPERWHRVVG